MALRVYETLLSNPDVDGDKIAEILDIEVHEVSAVLADLRRLSLVRESWEAPGTVHAVSPELGLGVLISQCEAELHRRRQELEQAKAAADTFIADHLRSHTSRHELELLPNADSARDRMADLLRTVDREISVFRTDSTISAPDREAFSLYDGALARGVRVRTIYLESARKAPLVWANATRLVERGAEVRTRAVLPCPLVIVDRQAALLPAAPDGAGQSAIVIQGQGVVSMLHELFGCVWDTSAPFDGEQRPRTDAVFDQTDREVLRLLAEGFTDETVARRLGVSLRTVRRIMSRLMRQLGAQSRFQAGVRVAALDLLNERDPA